VRFTSQQKCPGLKWTVGHLRNCMVYSACTLERFMKCLSTSIGRDQKPMGKG
jgi:hypothetical protein